MFDYTVSLYHYETPIDYLISQLKFQQQLSYAAILGLLLSENLSNKADQKYPDVIIPVPLHKNRLIKRGFNQSLEIARELTKTVKLPINYRCATREKATRTQSKLDAAQRKRNIKGCFTLKALPSYEHVVIIDDVVTTSATTNELARVLKMSGVKKVGVWSIARAELHKDI